MIKTSRPLRAFLITPSSCATRLLAPPGEQSNQFRPLVAVHVSVRGEPSAPGGWPRHVIVVDSS